MKLRTKHNGHFEVGSLQDVMVILTQLGWAGDADSFLVCDNNPDGFVQIAKWRPAQYILEWCGGYGPTHPQQGLWRARSNGSLGEIVTRGRQETGQFPLYQNDLLSLTDVLDVLTAFWRGEDRPRHLYWRRMAPEIKELIQFNDDKHGTISLSE